MSKSEVVENLKQRELDILLTLGAGDIDQLVKPIYEFYG
jgi:UDP-N-acetylmuramate-alanine ligase